MPTITWADNKVKGKLKAKAKLDKARCCNDGGTVVPQRALSQGNLPWNPRVTNFKNKTGTQKSLL